MNTVSMPEPFSETAKRKLHALGAILCKSFPDDVNLVLLLQRKNRIVATSNLEYDDVCLMLEDFIDSTPED